MTALEVIEAARRGEVGARVFTDVPIVCDGVHRPRYPALGSPAREMFMPGGIDLTYLRHKISEWQHVRPWRQADAE